MTTGARTYAVTVGASSVQLVAHDHNRLALVITPASGDLVTLSWGQAAVDGQGVVLYAGGVPLVLTRELHGRATDGPIMAIAHAGGGAVGVLDVAALP